MSEVGLSVVIGTYNRCHVLRGALESVLNQADVHVPYEVIVVDNNSTDDTRNVVEKLRNRYDNLVYCFESTQGVSHARNKGIEIARGSLIAFTDDDIRPEPNWVAGLFEGFRTFPEVDCIGGKVLPEPVTQFPVWLTTKYWTPLALLDLGDKPLELNPRHGAGLVGANLAVRASVFKDIGLFRAQLQRVKDSIGSLEDHEFQIRLWVAGKRLMYLPSLIVYAEVLEERLTRDYHRRWYCGHGHFYAVMRDEEFEKSRLRLFDVPAHLYRTTCSNLISWLKCRLTNNDDLKFQQELELSFFWGFLRKRFAERRSILRLR